MPKVLDDCVAKVKAQGKSEGDAFAICRKALNMSNDDVVTEKKRDEDGDIIIAENVSLNINADISFVEE